ncbi:MAG: sigma 54-interacting transcriptional regulator [Terriglobales bacterium]
MRAFKPRAGLEVRSSPIHGRGCFATRPIKKGTRVLEYTGRRLRQQEANILYHERPSTYLFGLPGNQTVIDGIGMASLLNHSCQPNCKPTEADERIYFFTLRNIAAGEELAIDYNIVNSNEREMPCHCDSRKCRGTMFSKAEMARRKKRAGHPPRQGGLRAAGRLRLKKVDSSIENRQLQEPARSKTSFCELVGASEAMRNVYNAITRVADSSMPVLIRGESGTGKELVARAIVATSPRCHQPFITVNCAVLPETLIEAELFGHEKGAFPGTDEARRGHFETVGDGTLFLDGISALGLGLQSKLVQVLEERRTRRLGARTSKKVNFRLLAASIDDLEEMVRSGRFREDLYYQLHVAPIFLAPLRERGGDIPLLTEHFVRLYCAAAGRPVKRVEAEAAQILEEYAWPGNVRELEDLVHRLVLSDSAVIKVKHLPQAILDQSTASQEALLIPEEGIDFDQEIGNTEVAYLQAALRRAQGNKSSAARLLHINPQRMKYLCRKHRLGKE